jgi:hypothetical protein
MGRKGLHSELRLIDRKRDAIIMLETNLQEFRFAKIQEGFNSPSIVPDGVLISSAGHLVLLPWCSFSTIINI